MEIGKINQLTLTAGGGLGAYASVSPYTTDKKNEEAQAELRRLMAENGRLLAALNEILGLDGFHDLPSAQNIAEKALRPYG